MPASLLQSLLEHGDFLNKGSAATYLRSGGIWKDEFVANLPLSVPAIEFWNSINNASVYHTK